MLVFFFLEENISNSSSDMVKREEDQRLKSEYLQIWTQRKIEYGKFVSGILSKMTYPNARTVDKTRTENALPKIKCTMKP